MTAVWHLWNLSKTANDQGDVFPIWGTCLGFQTLSVLAANDASVLDYPFASENYPVPLTLVQPAAGTSKLFQNAPPSVMSTATTNNSTMNNHHSGVAPVRRTFILLPNSTSLSRISSTS
jgi:gamma-glutamyl hydrolase